MKPAVVEHAEAAEAEVDYKVPSSRRGFRKREVREGFSRWNRLTLFAGVVILLSFFLLPWVRVEKNSFKAFDLIMPDKGIDPELVGEETVQAVYKLANPFLLYLIGFAGAVVVLFAVLSAVGLLGSSMSGYAGAATCLFVFLFGFWLWFDAVNLLEIIRVTGYGVPITFFALFVAILGNLIRSGWIPSERLE